MLHRDWIVAGTLAALAFLSGCSSPPVLYHKTPAVAESLATQDPAEIRRRYGDYATMAGGYWTYRVGDLTNWFAPVWLVPGASLGMRHSACDRTQCRHYVTNLIQYDPKTQELYTLYDGIGDGTGYRRTVIYRVQPDGSLTAGSGGTYRHDPARDAWVIKTLFGEAIYQRSSYEEFKAEWERLNQSAALARRRDHEDSIAFWDGASRAMQGASQGLAEARVQQQQQDARQLEAQRSLQRDLRAQDAQRDRASAAPASGSTQKPVAPVAATTAFAPAAMPSRNAAPVAAQRDAAAAAGPKLNAVPELIVACTRPTGPKSSFECKGPASIQRGHLEDISGHRTPDEMLASLATCPSPRRLQSATHLVWGCGIGATNNSTTMDRSAGVDVKGRNTYYCHDKETNCGRTTPP